MNRSNRGEPEQSIYPIFGRLSFTQLLLVLSHVFVRSCLPFKIGDHRQLRDILQRGKKDWEPRIGSEGFIEIKQRNFEASDPRMDGVWEEIRNTMIQGLCCFPVSGKDLRDQLRYTLYSIEQISAQGLNTICMQSQRALPSNIPLGSRANLALVCVSLSVMPSGYLPPLRWEFDNSTLTAMLSELTQSPLFPDGIDMNELRPALYSLELLFSTEDNRAATFSATPGIGDWLYRWKRESQLCVNDTRTCESRRRKRTISKSSDAFQRRHFEITKSPDWHEEQDIPKQRQKRITAQATK